VRFLIDMMISSLAVRRFHASQVTGDAPACANQQHHVMETLGNVEGYRVDVQLYRLGIGINVAKNRAIKPGRGGSGRGLFVPARAYGWRSRRTGGMRHGRPATGTPVDRRHTQASAVPSPLAPSLPLTVTYLK
jgi:hypothetical protein